MTIEPHKYKEKTRERGQSWQDISDNLEKLPEFEKVSARAVREKVTSLIERYKTKQRTDIAASGISPEITELDVLLEEILSRIEEFSKHYDKDKEKENEQKAAGEEIRQAALVTYKRKEESDSKGQNTSKKRRSSGSDTINFLQNKMETENQFKEKELQLQEARLELEKRKQEDQNSLIALFFQQMQQNQQLTHTLLEKLEKK